MTNTQNTAVVVMGTALAGYWYAPESATHLRLGAIFNTIAQAIAAAERCGYVVSRA